MDSNRRDFFKKTTTLAVGTGAITMGLTEPAYADHHQSK